MPRLSRPRPGGDGCRRSAAVGPALPCVAVGLGRYAWPGRGRATSRGAALARLLRPARLPRRRCGGGCTAGRSTPSPARDTSKGFTYPPFAVLRAAAAAAGESADAAAVTPGPLASLASSCDHLVGWSPRWPGGTAGRRVVRGRRSPCPLVLAMEPVRRDARLGPDQPVPRRAGPRPTWSRCARGPRWAGVGIGLATAIKLTPGLFVVYLLLTGRRRAAAVGGRHLPRRATLLAVRARSARLAAVLDARALGDRRGSAGRPDVQPVAAGRARPAGRPGRPDRAALGVLLARRCPRARPAPGGRAYRRGDELAGVTLVGLTERAWSARSPGPTTCTGSSRRVVVLRRRGRRAHRWPAGPGLVAGPSGAVRAPAPAGRRGRRRSRSCCSLIWFFDAGAGLRTSVPARRSLGQERLRC